MDESIPTTIPIVIIHIIVRYLDDEIVIGLADRFPELLSGITVSGDSNTIVKSIYVEPYVSTFLLIDIKHWKNITGITIDHHNYQIINDRTKYIDNMQRESYEYLLSKIKRYGYNISNSYKLSTTNGFKYFMSLRFLDCDETPITDDNLKHLKNLRYLSCCNCNQVSDTGIKGLIELTQLYCNHTSITDFGIQGLENLDTLSCDNTVISDHGIKNLIKLKILYCCYTRITNHGITHLLDLQRLRCFFTQITGTGMKELKNLKIVSCHRSQASQHELRATVHHVA